MHDNDRYDIEIILNEIKGFKIKYFNPNMILKKRK